MTMAQVLWTWNTKGFRAVLAVTLLALVTGCGGEPKPNTPPTFLEGTQSAEHVQALEAVTLRVTAQDAQSRSLRFSWEASSGTLGSPSETATTSEITWTASACGGASDVTVTVTVTDEQGSSASKDFALSRLRCRALFIASSATHTLARLADGTAWAWGEQQLGSARRWDDPRCALYSRPGDRTDERHHCGRWDHPLPGRSRRRHGLGLGITARASRRWNVHPAAHCCPGVRADGRHRRGCRLRPLPGPAQ